MTFGRIISFILTLFLTLLYSFGCISFNDLGFGSYHTENVEEYGNYIDGYEVPDFMPESLDGMDVVKYSYTVEAYFDLCLEIYLEVNLDGDDLDALIADVLASDEHHVSRSAYYDPSYTEIIFKDEYEAFEYEEDDNELIAYADIAKVIYNESTGTVIFECLYANDTAVMYVEQVEYFKRFEIDENEYVNQNGGVDI